MYTIQTHKVWQIQASSINSLHPNTVFDTGLWTD